SVTASAQFVLGLAVQTDPNQPLVITTAALTFANASIDSHNFSADVIKFLDSTMIPTFNALCSAQTRDICIHARTQQQKAIAFIDSTNFPRPAQFNGALAAINARLRGPAQYARIGLWGRSSAITIAFAPDLPVPNNGSMSGAIRWNLQLVPTGYQ